MFIEWRSPDARLTFALAEVAAVPASTISGSSIWSIRGWGGGIVVLIKCTRALKFNQHVESRCLENVLIAKSLMLMLRSCLSVASLWWLIHEVIKQESPSTPRDGNARLTMNWHRFCCVPNSEISVSHSISEEFYSLTIDTHFRIN